MYAIIRGFVSGSIWVTSESSVSKGYIYAPGIGSILDVYNVSMLYINLVLDIWMI